MIYHIFYLLFRNLFMQLLSHLYQILFRNHSLIILINIFENSLNILHCIILTWLLCH